MKSPYRGVVYDLLYKCFRPHIGSLRAEITVNRKRTFLGNFDRPEGCEGA